MPISDIDVAPSIAAANSPCRLSKERRKPVLNNFEWRFDLSRPAPRVINHYLSANHSKRAVVLHARPPYGFRDQAGRAEDLAQVSRRCGDRLPFSGYENKRHMLVAGHDGWHWRGSQPGLLDAEVGHATQYLLKHDPEFEANHIGAHAAVGA